MLLGYILNMLGDRMEMAHSIEGRVPFPDHHVVEVLRSQPVTQKIRAMREKYVLREAVPRPHYRHGVPETKASIFESTRDLEPKGETQDVQATLRAPVLDSILFFDQEKVIALLDGPHGMEEGSLVTNDQVFMTLVSACVLQERFRLAA